MNYFYKYKKYKKKYTILLKDINGERKNYGGKNDAIFMLCILKDNYVLGACIAAYTHRQFIKKIERNIDLVIMCDPYIYNKFEKTLKHYFDRVIKLDMRYFDILKTYKYAKKKYSSWFGYSLNKWQCLKYDTYKKILFLDVDILPSRISFYNIFSLQTPAFHILNAGNKYLNGNVYEPLKNVPTFDKFLDKVIYYGNINGGICLFTPNKYDYDKYVKMTDNIYKKGMYSVHKTSPDEATIFYYYLTKNVKIYGIGINYLVVPWDNGSYVKTAKAYNFLSFIKPWTKARIISWDEETLWDDIYNKMPKYGILKKTYIHTIEEGIKIYLKYTKKERKKYYNMIYINTHKKDIKYIISKKYEYKIINKIDKKIPRNGYGILKTNELKNILNI